MSKYKEKIVNLQTGTETYRDFTTEEILELETNQKKALEHIAKLKDKEATRLKVLEKLGLTADELKALLG